jgi:integrase
MEEMNVQEMTHRLKRLYPRIKPSTKLVWDKSIKPISQLNLDEVTDDVAFDYLDSAMSKWSESTTKARIGTLKGLWNKAARKKLYKGDNPWNDLDDGLQIATRRPEPLPWEFYEYYHDHPYFVFLWFTGARIGEIAGMAPENIVVDAAIPHFNIVDQSNRDLKNQASIRQVPIHPKCLPLIGKFKQSKSRNPGRAWSYRFNMNLGLPKYVAAHSIRHSFHTRCRDVGMPGYIINALTGHGKQSISDDYGSVKLELLDTYIRKL